MIWVNKRGNKTVWLQVL